MLDNYHLRTKLFLIALLATLPSIILLVLLLGEKDIAIKFAEKEYIGNEYLRPVRQLQEGLIQYRRQQLFGGGTAEQVAATEAALQKSLDALGAASAKHKDVLKQEARINSLRDRIKSIHGVIGNVSPAVAEEELATTRGEVRRLFSLVGDTSNLILDPDLDSYYLMDTVVLKAPALNDELAVSERLARHALTPEGLSASDRSLLLVSIGQLEALSEELERNLRTGFSATASEEMKSKMEPALEDYLTRLGSYLAYVDKNILADGAKPEAADLNEHLDRVGTAGFALWDRAVDQLDRLLRDRIGAFEQRKLQALLLVAIVVFISGVAVFAISGRLSERVGRLAAFSRELAAKPGEETKASAQIAALTSEDEVGELAKSVGEMALQIRRFIGELQASGAKLEEYNQTLEARVKERTYEIEEKNVELEKVLQQVKEAQNRLVTQEKLASLGSLTAGIAHEIKNPLNFVNNFAQLSGDLIGELRELSGRLDGKVDKSEIDELDDILGMLKQNVEKINEHGQRADGIVKGMLAHSRGKTSDPQPTDLNSLLTEYTKLAYHGLRAQDNSFNVTLEFQLDPNVGKVSLVAQDFSRAILNMVNNGCYSAHERRKKQGGDFSPMIVVGSRVVGDKVEVRIRDNGLGISKEKLEKIFEPFFTTKPTGQGTGLGLSMTYDIVVQQHQGELRVESEEGKFAEFIVTLPRV